MENIVEPNELFDFTKLTLDKPTVIQGGSYFTKLQYNKNPLYIQTTASQTKQGFVKNGKKYYADLMFDKNSEKIINWFENLENKCQKLIYEKKEEWFQNNLEEADIENAFNPIIRIFKSGKFYLLRVNVKNNSQNAPLVKIYDENHKQLLIDDIENDTNIVSILEINGIKFTSRSFQIEISIKQVMIVTDNDEIFETCLIKTNKSQNKKIKKDEITLENNLLEENDLDETDDLEKDINHLDETNDLEKDNDNHLEKDINHLEKDINHLEKDINHLEKDNDNHLEKDINHLEKDNDNHLEKDINHLEKDINHLEKDNDNHLEKDNNNHLEKDNDNIILQFEDLNEIHISNDLTEINTIKLSNDDYETLKLKKPNQVYFELYKQARKKAKECKKNAIIAYLEAKNIKKTYMIDTANNDSDSDFDAEIDEVSESELDYFE